MQAVEIWAPLPPFQSAGDNRGKFYRKQFSKGERERDRDVTADRLLCIIIFVPISNPSWPTGLHHSVLLVL